MSRRILFSPIGGTDPIRYFHDGSMLHICRHYKPDIVYMYMSHEMLEHHRADNRYVATLQLLGKHLGHSFEVNIIERDELIDVQEYDFYYEDFRKIILEIEKSMEDGDELIFNTASGTPAMKSALIVLSTLAEYKYRLIQVSTPQKKINSEYENRDELTAEESWELDDDNQEGAENRCNEIKCLNLVTLLKSNIIKKHIGVYDYAAALSVAEEIKADISPELYTLLQAADARIKLDLKKVSRLLSNTNYDILPIKDSDKQEIFEYELVLQTKIKKGELADFIRGITPIVVDLFEKILSRYCKIKLSDYRSVDKKGMPHWNEGQLKKDGLWEVLDAEYSENGGFNGKAIYSTHIAALIRNGCSDTALIQRVNDITGIERNVRNIAAHEIVSVTDDWIKSKTGRTAREIFDIIKYLSGMAGINASKKDWDSYDSFNAVIEAEFEKLEDK